MHNTIYTVGHSNYPFEELVSILDRHDIVLLVDTRSHPGSKTNPQFNKSNFEQLLGVRYMWMPELGGPSDGVYSDPLVFPKHHIGTVRPEFKGVPEHERPHVWWNRGLHDFSIWMATDQLFMKHLEAIDDVADMGRMAIMCAEALWWKCHRSMISDVWQATGGTVYHLMKSGKPRQHPTGEALNERLSRYDDCVKKLWENK